jgi:hypothetical protein
MIETLAALAIAAAIFAVVAEFAGRALRTWNRGETTISVMEMLTRGLGRLSTDLSLALPMSAPGTDGATVLFSGDANQMVFAAATGFSAGDRGIEQITIASAIEGDTLVLLRLRGPVSNPPAQPRDPVELLRGRMQIRFSYRDQKGQVLPTWINRPEMPSAVLVEIFGPARNAIFPAPMLMSLPMNLSVECLQSGDPEQTRPARCGENRTDGATPPTESDPVAARRGAAGQQQQQRR